MKPVRHIKQDVPYHDRWRAVAITLFYVAVIAAMLSGVYEQELDDLLSIID